MFGIDVKQIFRDKIYDILIVLCILHLGAVVVSYLLKWVRPYLKSYCDKKCTANSDVEPPKDSARKQRSGFCTREYTQTTNTFDQNESGGSGDEYNNLLDSLKSFDEFSQVLSQSFEKPHKEGCLVNEMSLGIENAIKLRKYVADSLQNNREAQTNITINPKLKIDLLCPDVVEVPTDFRESSDSFQSLSSDDLETDRSVLCVPVIRNIGRCNILEQSNQLNLRQSCVGTAENCKESVRSFTTESRNTVGLIGSIPPSKYEKTLRQDNEILEMAINEFEKELKPIKDQIKVLKECLSGLDTSDVSLSSSATFTTEYSTTTDITTYTKKPLHVVQRRCGPLMAEVAVLPQNRSYSIRRVSGVTQRTKATTPRRRSPLAELYIKLSQCSSQASGFATPRKHRTEQKEDQHLTCQINLNLSVGALSPRAVRISHQKGCKMLPVLSQPEDLFGSPFSDVQS